MIRPAVDIGACTLCMGCVEMCPEVFSLNEAAGYIQVADLQQYPQSPVNEAIKYCPVDAIDWEQE
jgi:ferredoxin